MDTVMASVGADAVEKKLDMSLADIVEERKHQSSSPNGAGGKSRNTKRSERIAQAGPYQMRAGRSDNVGEFDDGSAGRRVYVGNLSWNVQWQLLKDHMSAAGQVLHASVLESNGRSKVQSLKGKRSGCGIVEYATEEDAERAIATLNDSELDGRKIFVREDRETKPKGNQAPPMTRQPISDENFAPNAHGAVMSARVYVGNLSWNVKWQDLKDHMKVAGNVKHADVLSEANGRSKGCGLVEYESVEEAARAIAMLNDSDLDGRKIFVREDREPDGGSISSIAHRGGGGRGFGGLGAPRGAHFGRVPVAPMAPPPQYAPMDATALYVGNLPWDVTWQVLKDMFRSVGEVDRTEIAQFPDGRSRGFGIVRFVHPGDAARAIAQFNGSEMNGRPIEVRYDKGRA